MHQHLYWAATITFAAATAAAQDPYDEDSAPSDTSSSGEDASVDDAANTDDTDADGSKTPATDAGMSLGLSASTSEGVDAEAAATGADSSDGFWDRHKPEGGLWEIGLFGGLLFMSRAHRLVDPDNYRRAYDLPTYLIGGRIGVYPLASLGLEAEFMHGEGDVSQVDSHATFNAFRGHLVGQLPYGRLVPFGLVGLGGLTANSSANGEDTDTDFYFGVGAKFAINDVLGLRTDFRENLMQRVDDGLSFSEEIHLGLTLTLGRSEPPPAAPVAKPVDSDGDGIPDGEDACPDIKAMTPDGCPPDTDGDGIRDDLDECPEEKGVAPTGCPDRDADGDGILIPTDRCPDEVGVKPDGCPIRDRDGDGILDDEDKCPDEPETKNGFKDDDGCPDQVPEEVKAFTGVIKGISFQKGKAVIRKQSEAKLEKAVAVLQKYPSIRVKITGHTSSEGDPDFNSRLSEERADAVKQFMVDAGIDESRIETRGAGSDEPIADNKTEAGRSKNRRIEFKIIEQAGK